MGFCNNCNKEVDSKFCPSCGSEVSFDNAGTENTSEILDKLYALRAGLSKVSMEMDKVHSLENELEKKKKENDDIVKGSQDQYGDYNYFGGEVHKIRSVVREKNNEFKNARKKFQEDIEKSKKQLNTDKKDLRFCYILGGACALIALISFPFVIFLDLMAFTVLLYLSFFPLGFSILIGIADIKSIRRLNKDIAKTNKLIEDMDARIMSEEEINATLSNDPHYVEMLTKYNKARNYINDARNYNYSKHQLAIKNQQDECAVFYNEFYNSYLSSFKDVIDERDWRNVDLIIFMLESKRASSLKEALQQVDTYRHTEMIAQVIVSATEAICNKIQYEASKISFAIENCVDSLNSKLQMIADNQSNLNANINAVNDSIKKSINATELQNAMIAKSNATSEQMANDIAQIKSFAGRPYGHI